MINNFDQEIDTIIRISILSQLDIKILEIIKALHEKNPREKTFQHIQSLGVNTLTYRKQIDDKYVKIILVQPVSEYFTHKILSRFYDTSCAILPFDKNDHHSFIAAKVFYQQFKKLETNRNPFIAFIELVEDNNIFIVDEPEILSENPRISYYTINKEDDTTFALIGETLVKKYLISKKILD